MASGQHATDEKIRKGTQVVVTANRFLAKDEGVTGLTTFASCLECSCNQLVIQLRAKTEGVQV